MVAQSVPGGNIVRVDDVGRMGVPGVGTDGVGAPASERNGVALVRGGKVDEGGYLVRESVAERTHETSANNKV